MTTMSKLGQKLSATMLSAVLMLSLCGTPLSYATPSSTASGEPVSFSKAEADSILMILDGYETKLRLTELALARSRAMAEVDSLAFAEYRQAHTENWLEQLINHPVVWLAVGVYLGVQATTWR